MSDTDTQRLAKFLAAQQGCSRRAADNYITGGWVRVDGKVVEEPGYRIRPDQRITLAPEASPEDVKPVTLLLHKPVGLGASEDDVSAAKLLLPENLAADFAPDQPVLKRHLTGLTLAASLETEASGLIVATQEFRIIRKLLDDAAHVEMEYVVHVNGTLSDADLKKLNRPWVWEGKSLAYAAKVSWQSDNHLRFALKTPPAHLIATMCQQVGLTVLSIKRLRIGGLSMGGLPVGQWRYLLSGERF